MYTINNFVYYHLFLTQFPFPICACLYRHVHLISANTYTRDQAWLRVGCHDARQTARASLAI